MTKKSEIREHVREHFKKLLIGPIDGEEEVVLSDMRLRYMLGVLFPKNANRSDIASESEDAGDDADLAGEATAGNDEFSVEADNPLSLANQELPSSVGISFLVSKGAKINVRCSAGSYLNLGEREWKRVPFRGETQTFVSNQNIRVKIFNGFAEIDFHSRPIDNGDLITVSLLNLQENEPQKTKSKKNDWEKCLYQVSLTCTIIEGDLLPYGQKNSSKMNVEEQIQELQFLSQPHFAVGHGSSCSWDSEAKSVWVEYLPSEFVYRPTYDKISITGEHELVFEHDEILSLEFLSNSSNYPEKVCSFLSKFCDFYEKWITSFREADVNPVFLDAVRVLEDRASQCLGRMRYAVELLNSKPEVRNAFIFANLAMLEQMAKSAALEKERSSRLSKGMSWPVDAAEQIAPPEMDFANGKFRWRPFQLAFALTVIPSLCDGASEDEQSLVDLIWFTTGGGKTEAYFLVAAFEIIRRRLEWGQAGEGTAVITRYTYRFLTADQFSRTSRLICSLESLRRRNPNLGVEPISLGLWVGGGLTPNHIVHPSSDNTAEQVFEKILGSDQPRKDGKSFQITECPNCGTALLPEKAESNALQKYGFRVSASEFRCFCPNLNCEFDEQSGGLPICMIDAQLYKTPPTFLIGTIDKFANLALKEESASFLGINSENLPPSLIIQDELHLISGPLGTVAAIFEAGLDEAIRELFKKKGMSGRRVKYVASTATIANASDQVRRLFGRKLALFPPRGIKGSDSFFSREEKSEDTARLYIGLMPQALRSTSAAHWTSAAILESVDFVRWKHLDGKKEEIDFLWTLLCYCNSKRELGLLNRSVNGEIEDRISVYRNTVENELLEPARKNLRKTEVSADAVSNVAEIRDELSQKSILDIVPCTNMVSVGIDINRLGLMMVNGQPKGTSEYIQATSRVGRRPEDIGPGLVVTLYSPSKPRDRSHYEQFKNYHSSLYRMVEPTSVTPGSQPALNKVLHAAFVSYIRFAGGLLKESDAGNFSTDNMASFIENFINRLKCSYTDDNQFDFEREQIENKLAELVREWENNTRRYHNLRYRVGPSNHQDFGLMGEGRNAIWKPITSMRSVDSTIEIKPTPNKPASV